MIDLKIIIEDLPKYFQDEILEDGMQARWLDLIILGDKASLVAAYNSMSKEWQPTKGIQEHLRYKWQKIIKNYLRKQADPSLLTYDEVMATGDYVDLFGSYGLKEHHLYVKVGNVWYPKIDYAKQTAADVRKEEYHQKLANDQDKCRHTA